MSLEGRIPWERRWLLGDEPPTLYSGLLADSSFYPAPSAVRLAELDGCRCLVLLGDAGAGKTTEADREVERLRSAGRLVERFDLGGYAGWGDLKSEVFDGPWMREWLAGGENLTLVLDGFDEAAITSAGLAEGLVGQFERLGTARLRLRITGRPGARPQRLSDALQSLWSESFAQVTLAPLTAGDVTLAADRCLAPGHQFLQQVLARDIGPLAARPITLRFLLSIAAQDGQLPVDRAALYRQGVDELASELNPGLRDTLPLVPLGDPLQAAEQLAALTSRSQRWAALRPPPTQRHLRRPAGRQSLPPLPARRRRRDPSPADRLQPRRRRHPQRSHPPTPSTHPSPPTPNSPTSPSNRGAPRSAFTNQVRRRPTVRLVRYPAAPTTVQPRHQPSAAARPAHAASPETRVSTTALTMSPAGPVRALNRTSLHPPRSRQSPNLSATPDL